MPDLLRDTFGATRTRTRIAEGVINTAAAVITVSNYNNQYLQALTGIGDRKIVVVPPCCDLNRFADIERQDDDCTLVSVGRLVEKKGLQYGIEAFARLRPAFPELRYRIVGAGSLRSELTALATRPGVTGRIEFTGAVDQDGIARILSDATVMVLPCVRATNGDLDGTPLALRKAMAAGVRVVATRVARIPELIESEKQGLVVEAGDAEGLAETIRRQLLDKDISISMALAAESRVTEHVNMGLGVRTLLWVWEDTVLRESGDGPSVNAMDGHMTFLHKSPASRF